MNCMRIALSIALAATVLAASFPAYAQEALPETPTLHVTSNLVFLDVTVLDKQNKPVVTGLTKDDFVISEDKQRQPIFSFEPPEAHTATDPDNPDGKSPLSIFVLDRLNSDTMTFNGDFDQFGALYEHLHDYIAALPKQLPAPAELMVMGNRNLELLQGFTRDRDELLFALNHMPAVVPYKALYSGFDAERFQQSMDALQQIALQNSGTPGRKNIIWVGHGAPNLPINTENIKIHERFMRYVHDTVDLLTNQRITLFVVNPSPRLAQAHSETGNSYSDKSTNPFTGDINFAQFSRQTGGSVFYNRNDIDKEIGEAEELGSRYYTLTYRPHLESDDGKFRRITVTMRDPNLRAVTRTGYFNPDKNSPQNGREQSITHVSEAVRSTLPVSGLNVVLFRVVRLVESHSAVVTVMFPTKDLDWQPDADGKRHASVLIAAASTGGSQNVVASKMEAVSLEAKADEKDNQMARVSVKIQVPKSTKRIRVVVTGEGSNRAGSIDVSRAVLDASPEGVLPKSTAAAQ